MASITIMESKGASNVSRLHGISVVVGTIFGVRPNSKGHVGGWRYGLVGSSHSECMGAVARHYDPKP